MSGNTTEHVFKKSLLKPQALLPCKFLTRFAQRVLYLTYLFSPKCLRQLIF